MKDWVSILSLYSGTDEKDIQPKSTRAQGQNDPEEGDEIDDEIEIITSQKRKAATEHPHAHSAKRPCVSGTDPV